MHETSGVLRPVIEKYLNHQPLRDDEIATMRTYLRQWVGAPVWHPGPELDALRATVGDLKTVEALHGWCESAAYLGMDPI